MEQQTGSKQEKEYIKAVYCHSALFNLYAEYIMRNSGLGEAQAGTKIVGRNIKNLRYADDTTLMTESEEELKSLLMKVKEESEKVGLKLIIQKTKIMASSPITSWQIDGETVETVSDFIFWDSKITADGDCSHELKRRLLLGRKLMTNLESKLKSRDITWDCKEIQPVHPNGDQSWVLIGRTDVEAETPIFWPPDAKSWLIWEDPDAGKDWGQEEKGTTEDEMVGWHHMLGGHGFR